MLRLVILGAGGHGRTVKDLGELLGYEVIMLDDNKPGLELMTFGNYIADDTVFMPAFGNNPFRMEWIGRIREAGGRLATIVHPKAVVSPSARLGEGVVVLALACIGTEVCIGDGGLINMDALIDHGCVIEEGCHIGLGVIVESENRIKALSKVESGTVIPARSMAL